jgi:hypothetical protein
MTTRTRIENADTSGHGLRVSVFEIGQEGQPDTLVMQFDLDQPCQMTGPDLHASATRYIVVREKEIP